MRRIVVGLALVLATIAGSLGFSIVAPSVAGAVPVACNIGNQGWYQHGTTVGHCVVDGNHYTIDIYSSQGYIETIEWWQPSGVYHYIVEGTPTVFGYIAFCPSTWLGVSDVSPAYTYVVGWDEQFRLYGTAGLWVEGAMRHSHEQPSTVYGDHEDVGYGFTGCPYGGIGYIINPVYPGEEG